MGISTPTLSQSAVLIWLLPVRWLPTSLGPIGVRPDSQSIGALQCVRALALIGGPQGDLAQIRGQRGNIARGQQRAGWTHRNNPAVIQEGRLLGQTACITGLMGNDQQGHTSFAV